MADLLKEKDGIWEALWMYKKSKMKNIFLFLFLIFNTNSNFAQEKSSPAIFPGGDSAWIQYLDTSFHRQQMAEQITKKDRERFGSLQRVVYSFNILVDGTIGIINIETATSQVVRNAINRVLKDSPLWIPATLNGMPSTYRKRQTSTFTFD